MTMTKEQRIDAAVAVVTEQAERALQGEDSFSSRDGYTEAYQVATRLVEQGVITHQGLDSTGWQQKEAARQSVNGKAKRLLDEAVGQGRILRFSSRDKAVESGVVAGRSAVERGARRRPRGAAPHTNAVSDSPLARSSAEARALAIVASIFCRLRTMPASPSRRRTSRAPNRATSSIRNPANACRNAGRFRRIVSHESPDWNPSRQSRSNRPSSSTTGRPHSSS